MPRTWEIDLFFMFVAKDEDYIYFAPLYPLLHLGQMLAQEVLFGKRSEAKSMWIQTLEYLSFSASPQSNMAVAWTFLLQPIGGNERFLSPALLSFRSDGNDRSFRSMLCLEWNQPATVLYTLQSLSILTGFLYGDFMTKGFISHHTFPKPFIPGGIFIYNHKKKKNSKKTCNILLLPNISSLHCSCY